MRVRVPRQRARGRRDRHWHRRIRPSSGCGRTSIPPWLWPFRRHRNEVTRHQAFARQAALAAGAGFSRVDRLAVVAAESHHSSAGRQSVRGLSPFGEVVYHPIYRSESYRAVCSQEVFASERRPKSFESAMPRSGNGRVRYTTDAFILLALVGQIRNRTADRIHRAMRLTVRNFAASEYVVVRAFWS